MNDFILTLAEPESPDDCVAEPFLPLVRSPLWVAYLTFGQLYLADVNDDPDLEDEYDAGVKLWVERVQALLDLLSRRYDGLAVQISVSTQARAGRFLERLIGRADREVTIEESSTIDPGLLEGLSSFGGQATLWTSLPDGLGVSDAQESLTMPRLEELIRQEVVPWWVSHGYKEPFLVGRTPTLTRDTLADVIRTHLGKPVELANEAFVPHRVRIHRGHA